MSAELKPCPFCGKQPRPKWYGASGEDDDSGYWGIDCCQAFSHEGTEAEAATAWNRRARSALAGDGETVREALEAAQVALSDWLVMYAADQCDAESVKQAIDRVGQYGTLAYITGVQQKIETALRSLSALPSPMPADSAALDEMARIAWFDEHNIGGSSDETPVDIWIGGNWLFAIPLGVLRKVRSAVTTRHGTAKPPMPVRGEITGEILAELLDFLKLHKAQFFQPGWTNRDRDELMAIMHKGNAVALSASPSPPIPAVEIDGEKR